MTEVEQVLSEVERATAKFPTWPTDPLHALAVLGEEYGELNKAMLQLTYEPHKTSADEVRKEAIQTAAMALRLVMSLDRYEYNRCPQHKQGAPLSSDAACKGFWNMCSCPKCLNDDRKLEDDLDSGKKTTSQALQDMTHND